LQPTSARENWLTGEVDLDFEPPSTDIGDTHNESAVPVNENETTRRRIYCSASSLVAGGVAVAGLLIQTSLGGAPAVGAWRTKRSGCAA
jgi:hypothetical protein